MALPHHTGRRPRGSRTSLSVLLVAAFLAAGCSRTSGTQAADDPREVSPAPSPASTAPWALPPSPTGAGTPTPADAPASTAAAPETTPSETPSEPPAATPEASAGATVPAMPDFPADTLAASKAAAALKARGQDPRTNPLVRATDFACFAHEVQTICLSYLSGRGLGTSAAIAGIEHPRDETPDPTRPRPLPILPPGCVIAATVPTGHLVTCADDS